MPYFILSYYFATPNYLHSFLICPLFYTPRRGGATFWIISKLSGPKTLPHEAKIRAWIPGLEKSGISDAIKLGSTGLPNLDPFHDIDPMVTDDEVNGLPIVESTPLHLSTKPPTILIGSMARISMLMKIGSLTMETISTHSTKMNLFKSACTYRLTYSLFWHWYYVFILCLCFYKNLIVSLKRFIFRLKRCRKEVFCE